MAAEQKLLFNEAEVLAAIEVADAAHEARTTSVEAHERKRHTGGREAIPAHLPRKEIVHDLPNEQKHCEHDGVCWAMERIGDEVSERYHYEAPKVWVERHVRPKWGCARCHQGVHIAPCPAQILPKSNASASLLAALSPIGLMEPGMIGVIEPLLGVENGHPGGVKNVRFAECWQAWI
jgi:transposase